MVFTIAHLKISGGQPSRALVTRRKLSLLQLAQEMNNVSEACQIVGYSRATVFRDPAQLPDPRSRGSDRSLAVSSRSAPEPGQPRGGAGHPGSLPGISHAGAACASPRSWPLKGGVSSGGVGGVRGRHHLLSKHERLLRLEEHTRQRRIDLNEQQICLLLQPRVSRSTHRAPLFSGLLPGQAIYLFL